jgi:hypothetical protein
MSTDQKDRVFESATYDWVWYDEPVSRNIYTAAERGLMKSDGSSWMTMTLVSEPWIYDELIVRAEEGDDDIKEFYVDIEDNCVENGGYLTRSAIEAYKKKIPEDELETRTTGKPRAIVGRVYKEFDRAVHVLHNPHWERSWPVYVGIDIHPRKECAIVFVGVTPDDTLIVLDEIFEKLRISELIKRIKEKELYYNIRSRVIDTIAASPGWDGVAAKDELEKGGLTCRWARKKNNLIKGIQKIQDLLLPKPLVIDPNKSLPRLFVHVRCRRVKKEFFRYVWDNFKDPASKGVKEVPKKVFDDCMDALRYVILERPRYDLGSDIIDLNDHYRQPSWLPKTEIVETRKKLPDFVVEELKCRAYETNYEFKSGRRPMSRQLGRASWQRNW